MNIHEAKTHFSKLVAEVQGGREVVITKSGRPVAKLVPLTGSRAPRKPGGWEGRLRIAPDFDSLDQSTLASFEGGND